MRTEARVEDLLRQLTPQVLAALVRRHGDFDACEDAVQEALLAAATQWPRDGLPERPRAWLVAVATRRLTDEIRANVARRRREDRDAQWRPAAHHLSSAGDGESAAGDRDDTLTLLFLCCHPDLSPPSQLALTLRAVGGLTTAEIATAFFVPEATMAQRISRAKQRIKAAGGTFEPPPAGELAKRLQVVLQVLYLIFNEGYTTSSGPELQRSELTAEAIRLTRIVHAARPDDGEIAGLLALMLLTDARRAARTTADGALVPLAEQDRSLWNAAAIDEGSALIAATLAASKALGPYQLQAAIAAVHDEAPSDAATDWPQIVALYELLEQVGPNPMVSLNHAVAVAMVDGPAAGLARLDDLIHDERMVDHHRVHAVRAHLLEISGDVDGARDAYRAAARRTLSLPEQRYLDARAARLPT